MSILFRSEQDEIPQHTREAMDSLFNTISDLQKSNKTLRASLKEAYLEGWADGASRMYHRRVPEGTSGSLQDWDLSSTKQNL